MKEIWINLELYFKRYDFYNFYGFFWIFPIFNDFIFYLNRFKINKNNKIYIYIIFARGTRVDATWHARPRGSATRTRAAPTWSVYTSSINIIFYIV